MAKNAAALHILVKHRIKAQQILTQLRTGGDFQKLAKQHSTCPSAKKGGDLGQFQRGQMVPAFDRAVFTCPLLEPYGPVKTPFGYHIIKVLWRN